MIYCAASIAGYALTIYFVYSCPAQGLFVFCLPWSIGSLMTSESRREFDALLRDLLLGTNKTYTKPKSFKLGKGSVRASCQNVCCRLRC